jgi:hypothetical protein
MQCPRCNSTELNYYHKQVRNPDEGLIMIGQCTNCDYSGTLDLFHKPDWTSELVLEPIRVPVENRCDWLYVAGVICVVGALHVFCVMLN